METISSKNEYPLKKISQFVFDQEHSIYTHPDNITIEYQDGGEAYILESLKKINDLSSNSQEFKQYIKDWPSRYHFSIKRINFLEGIKEILPQNAKVLEIGSGCGTITRWLGEHFHSVDALEGNTQRAGITRYRTKDLDNIKVYCGNLLATSFDKKYDIITLIGSLEYLPFYDTEYNNPKEACSALLTRLKDALNKNGILVIAIENKFGAKYFSGCKEDHTGKEFEGIIGYPEKTPVTFSRNEIESIIINSGFNYNQFYHVFPDYKLTETIIPENSETLSLYPQNWIRTPFEDYSGKQLNLFPDALFITSIADSGLLWQFSNSFVIITTKTKSVTLSVDWLIKKFRNNENDLSKFYHNITLFKKKSPIPSEKKYIVQRSSLFDIPSIEDNEKFQYKLYDNDFIFGRLLSYDFFAALLKKYPEHNLKQILKDFHDELLRSYSLGKDDPEGYPLITGEAIDYTFWNIIVTSENKFNLIDNKWRSKEPLPADLILFRNLFNIFDKISPFLKNKNKKFFIIEMIQDLYPHYSEKRLTENLQFERRFQTFVSGREQNLTIESFVQYCVNEQVQQNQVMTAQITNLNQILSSKDQQLLEISAQVTNLYHTIADKEQQLLEISTQVTNLNQEINILKEENNSMKSSISYRLLTKFQMNFIEPLFPQNSKRREIYDLGLKGGRILIKDGWKKFHLDFKNYQHTKRALKKLSENNKKMSLNYQQSDLIKYEPDPEKKLIEELNFFLSDQKRSIIFPKFENPIVSVIILTFNKAPYTLQCLQSLLEHTDIPYEVLIVDNGSTDTTPLLLKQIDNVVEITHEKNLGFIIGCNEGAKKAKGKYLLFLNNDTVVTKKWLSRLVKTLETYPNCGAVGCKLVWPNGQLQEAGSIVWNDGAALGYGRGDNPLKPEYSYLREVDYCSGACLLVRTDLFKKLDGFDERYIPAYYEDSDLCLGIQNLGYNIVYQPDVTVYHHEFTSSSKELAKKYMKTNQLKFIEKWEEYLPVKKNPSLDNVLDARDVRKRKKILFLDDRIPARDQGSGYPRANKLLSYLGEFGNRVTFYPLNNPIPWQPYTQEFQQTGIEIFYGENLDFQSFAQKRANYYDIIFVSRPHNFEKTYHIIKLYFPNAKLIYDAEALFSTREILKARVEGIHLSDQQIKDLQMKEINQINKADLITTVSENEKQIILKMSGQKNIFVLGHPITVQEKIDGFCIRGDILFVGGFLAAGGPNDDAVIYFLREIWPKLEKILSCKIYIVGINPPDTIKKFSSESVIVTGYVEDLQEYYKKCRVFVVPHRYAAGIPWKLQEAMSYGIPSVISDVIASQLNLKDGEKTLVAGDPEEFIKKIELLYGNEKLWMQIQQNAIDYIATECKPETIKNSLRDILDCRA